MAKIIQVLNSMIAKNDRIKNVIKNNQEYFFVYDEKYKWSITKNIDEDYFIHFYPDQNRNIDEISAINDWNDYDYVTYSTTDLKTLEAIETFRELYQIVSDKVYGIDNIFDDIINN
ncbi:hypothetical protein AB4Y90_16375 [Chryseobacterium sp. 2TAF14]|uniref:hypothetical protein n=1 Tax=Chryseobacterium sp. 2TAF14 TaxID=3233007 RepID=UPI003F91AD6F